MNQFGYDGNAKKTQINDKKINSKKIYKTIAGLESLESFIGKFLKAENLHNNNKK